MADGPLIARSAFAGMLIAVGTGRGVTVCDRDGLGLATVAARRGRTAALRSALHMGFGVDLPLGPTRSASRDVAFVGTAPGVWLAVQERGANELAAALEQALGEQASVTDQSDGYGVLRLQGPMVRDALAKLVPLDLHPGAFRPGDAASTVASHMGVTLWRLDDSGGSAVFEIAVFRSLAGSFWHALAEGAAEYGVAVGRSV